MPIEARYRVPPFESSVLESIASVLGDTQRGLTGSELGHRMRECNIPDVDPQNTKWKRLFNAFVACQNEHRVGNHVVKFINVAMSPAAHTDAPDWFEERRGELNKALSFAGMELGVDGKVRRIGAEESRSTIRCGGAP